jgi:chitin disaccharide deacetylase
VIVNADDFGYDESRNAGVVRAFQAGLVSSATIMATMPGFEEAAALARQHDLLEHVGVHLVLNEGPPLTEPIRRCERFCDDDGMFRQWLTDRRLLGLGRREQDAVAIELWAQIDRCRLAGLPLTHADSHYNTHTEPGVLRPVIRVVREAGVPHLRLMQNRHRMSLQRHVLVTAVNGTIRAAGLARTRGFGSYDDLPQDDSFELMTHPVVDAAGRLTDDLVPGPELAELVPTPGTHVSFAGVRYRGRPRVYSRPG